MSSPRPVLENQVDRLREPFAALIQAQTTASAILLGAIVLSLVLANGTGAQWLNQLQQWRVGILVGDLQLAWTLQHLVNDGLIALFFFLIGLEVKRELLVGELRDARRVGLLLCAAAGGMVVPALIYALINLLSTAGVVSGWGIPMATDTAIALGVLAALAGRVPPSVVAFLVGVAVVDDIGAILVIALFYTEQLSLAALALAGGLWLGLMLLNRAGMRHPLLYALLGIGLWAAIVQSGVHASIAGVIVAAVVPARARKPTQALSEDVEQAAEDVAQVDEQAVLEDAQVHERIVEVERSAQEATTPLRRWEEQMRLPVALTILPLFAFLNAGVVIDGEALVALWQSPVAVGILLGLVLGKPLGILGGIWLGERLGWARRPAELSLARLWGVGLLAGVGFTMSTFIAHLALPPGGVAMAAAKLAIILASTLAALLGFAVLRWAATSQS